MAIDAVKLSEKVDVIILMTGDGDFVPLVEYLHGRGVIVEVAAFGESTNSQLRECVDHFYDLSSSQKYLIRAGRRVGSKPKETRQKRGRRHAAINV